MALTQNSICDFGWKARDFALEGIDGKTYSLADVRGPKGVLVVFICNHCPYVKASIDRLVQEAEALSEIGIGTIAIMPNDTAAYREDSFDNMKAFAARHGFTFPYVIDETQEVARAYRAQCTPDFFGFNAKGELQYRGRLDASRTTPIPNARRDLFEAMKQVAETGRGPVNALDGLFDQMEGLTGSRHASVPSPGARKPAPFRWTKCRQGRSFMPSWMRQRPMGSAIRCTRMLINDGRAYQGRETRMFQFTANAASRGLFAGVVAAAMLCWPAIGADNTAVPNFSPDNRTGWIAGVPDGETPIGDDFLQPLSGPGPVTFERAHPYIDNQLARRTGKQPTNRVADLSNPILQPWVREQLRKLNARALTETMLFTPKERCWPIGVPGFLLYPVTPVYFLQTEKQVVMIWEEDHMARHVYLTDKHSSNVKPSWFGESIGHYENGDTLVIDTIGLSTRTFVDSYQTPHTEQLHVVERFKIIEGGKALEAIAYVEDPGAFTMPWSAVQRYRRADRGPMGEAVCAENNDKFFGYDNIEPIPTAHKPDF